MLDGAWIWESDPGSGIPKAPEHVCEKVQRERLFFSTIEFCRAYGNHWKDMKQQCHLIWDHANYTTSQELQTGFLNFDWIRRQAIRHIRAVDYCLCKRSHIHGNFRTMLPDIKSDAEMEVDMDEEKPNEQIHHPIPLNSHCFGIDEDVDDWDHLQYCAPQVGLFSLGVQLGIQVRITSFSDYNPWVVIRLTWLSGC